MARRFDCGVFDGQEPENGLNNGPAGTIGSCANAACAIASTNITPRVRTWTVYYAEVIAMQGEQLPV